MSAFDVYSFGVVSSSTLYRIKGEFPGPDGYAEIVDVLHMTGGEAANSSIVLARLGSRVKLDGNWIGADDGGRRTKVMLDDFQIDTSRLPLKENYKGVEEVVFAATGTRAIFGTYIKLQEDSAWSQPREEDIGSATVVNVDPFFGEASLSAAEMGFRAGKPVVTVDCRYDDPLLEYTTAVVVAESFLSENYAEEELEDIFRRYQQSGASLVIFTFGGKGSWYARGAGPAKTAQAYSIEPIDTAGAGDSFRAGIVYGLLQGWDDERMIDFASALAAIVCTRFPGVLDAPTYDEVLSFMETARTSAQD